MSATPRSPSISNRLTLRPLWSERGLSVVATAWDRDRHPESSDACLDYTAIEFMRAGCFEKRAGRRSVLADPATVVFHGAGESFAIGHPIGVRNAGTTIRIDAAALEEWKSAGLVPRRLERGSAHCPSSLLLEAHRWTARLARGGDDIDAEESVVDFAQRALALAAVRKPKRTASSTADRAASDVRLLLNDRYASSLRLADAAAAAGCSIWHVSRLFRQATGTTIHAALTALRLRHALERLRDGERDLTRLALSLGFASHSHFTSAFRTGFGVTPSAARARLDASVGSSSELDRAAADGPGGSRMALRARDRRRVAH